MMNVIPWNYRGARKSCFPGLIRDLKYKYNTCIIILMETHISGTRCQEIIKKMGFNGSYVSNALGHSGVFGASGVLGSMCICL